MRTRTVRHIGATAVALILVCAVSARPNPIATPIPGAFQVRELIPEIAGGTSAERRDEFVEHMLAGGDRAMWEKNAAGRAMMLQDFEAFDTPMAEYFTAQIERHQAPSANRHSWYRKRGSSAGRAMICDALGLRLEEILAECESGGSAASEWLTPGYGHLTRLLGFVEVPSDYGDLASQENLDRLTALLAAPGLANLSIHEFKLWWYVHHAAERLRDPTASRVAVPDDSGVVHVHRGYSDVVHAELCGEALDAEAQRLILIGLEGSRRISYVLEDEVLVFRDWQVELRFSDGAIVKIAPCVRDGIIEYEDNLRYSDNSYQVENPDVHWFIREYGREADAKKRASRD